MTPQIAINSISGSKLALCPDPHQQLLGAYERISHSKLFRRAKRLLELLRFCVERTLDGIPVDQTAIARAVFQKDSDFDSGTDPLVRVQFSRLRYKLEEYYSNEGAGDPYRIVVAPRGYGVGVASLPRLEPHDDAQSDISPASPEQGDHATPLNPRALAVLPFVNLTNNPDHDTFCHGLTDEIISGLTPWDGVEVVARGSAFQFGGAQIDVREMGRELSVGMVLEGSIRMEDGRTRATVQLCSTETGFTLWSQSFEQENGKLLDVEAGFAQEIVGQLKTVLPRPGEAVGMEKIQENNDSELQLT